MINQEYDLLGCEILKEFVHCGYDCSVVWYQNHFCGYVEIPKHHKLYGKTWNDEENDEINVYGGITYNQVTDNNTWFGWDAAHAGDYCINTSNPNKMELKQFINSCDDKLWILDMAILETANLAEQLKKLE